MNADEINKVQDDHDRIGQAIENAIKDNNDLITHEKWVGHLCDAETMTRFAIAKDNIVYVNFCVYTQITGGSYERPEAEIPLDTLNKYL